MTINFFVFGTLCFIFLILLPIIILFTTKNNLNLQKIFMGVFSVFYFATLIFGTICTIESDFLSITFSLKFNEPWFKINFLFFNSGILNILINIFMFLPLGFIVFTFSKQKPILKTIIFALALSIFIEIYQAILPIYRDSEIGDVIMNTLSGTISALFCKFLQNYRLFANK